jgi:signal transduction histidine kinase
MLHEFLTLNGETLISRCKAEVAKRSTSEVTPDEPEYGIPKFLGQLIALLGSRSGGSGDGAAAEISETAAKHGKELFLAGFPVDQVVNNYADLRQAITQLAIEKGMEITLSEFKTFNEILDEAITAAVTEHARGLNASMTNDGVTAAHGQATFLEHELKVIDTSILAADAIRLGHVGIGGSTGDVLSRNLARLHTLTADALFEARLIEGTPRPSDKHELVVLSEFIDDIQATATSDAESRRLTLIVPPVEPELAIDVDPGTLAKTVRNLLRNALGLAKPGGHVWLKAVSSADRVLIEVEDDSGGLPPEKADLFSALLNPETDQGLDPGTDPGLDPGHDLYVLRGLIAMNGGTLQMRNMPGKGCLFTIDFPRRVLPPKVA